MKSGKGTVYAGKLTTGLTEWLIFLLRHWIGIEMNFALCLRRKYVCASAPAEEKRGYAASLNLAYLFKMQIPENKESDYKGH